jgi:4'-phosphopantetheinyl transferase EntD
MYQISFATTTLQVPERIRERFPLLSRAQEFFAARVALREAASALGTTGLVAADELSIERHLHLAGHPNLLCSLAHTKNLAVGLAAKAPPFLSVGVDIEWCKRIVTEKSERYFGHPDDSPFDSKLELWVLKEAAFKAISPLTEDLLTLNKICIQGNEFFYREYRGSFERKDREIEGEQLLVAIALIKA